MLTQDFPLALITANGQVTFSINGQTVSFLNVATVDELWFQIAAGGAPTFTVAVEGSMDDSNWSPLAFIDEGSTTPTTLVTSLAAAAAPVNKIYSLDVEGLKSVRFTITGFTAAGSAPAAFVKAAGAVMGK